MFGFASKEDIRQVEDNLRTSFSSVKQDVQHALDWVQYLYGQQQLLLQKVDAQAQQVSAMPKSRDELKVMVSHAVEQVSERVREVEQRMDGLHRVAARVEVLEQQQVDAFAKLRDMQSHLDSHRRQIDVPSTFPDVPRQGTMLKEKVIRLAVRNSKDVIKESIMKLVRTHGQISGVALRESIVHEQGLCSKSSFYRILEDLESSPDVTVIDEGKEKRYVWGPRSKKVKSHS